MYSNISDCDEVYNFWEPLHYYERGYGFQTWESSPQYAIRSWAYILVHHYPVSIIMRILNYKRAAFFGLRIVFAIISSLCEARLYRAVLETVNLRVARYLFFALLFSAGMWNAATAFLPSSFAMYANTLAFSFALQPPSLGDSRRTLAATVLFALGAVVGWPFAAAVAIPFVLEELFVYGVDRVAPDGRLGWQAKRIRRLLGAGLTAATTIVIPVVAVDTLAYGRLTVTPWNIVKYNVFGGSARGPELYGTEPWHFYLLNLLLNFNALAPLALLSLPALAVTYAVDRKRLSVPVQRNAETGAPAVLKENKGAGQQSSPYTLLAYRLAPFYVWFIILTAQKHKEERFMFPVYPLLAFNAAVTLYLSRGWLEVAFIKATKSQYRAGKSSLFQTYTLAVMAFVTLISISRILALSYYYHAPLGIVYNLETVEFPRVLNATGLLPPPPPPAPFRDSARERDELLLDLSPLKELNITLCLGKEWYRFPSHWLIPDGVHVQFIKSAFDGALPRHFVESKGSDPLWRRDGTRVLPEGLNDLNKEEPSVYVDLATCHYLIDLDFPKHPREGPHEPRYAVDSKRWDRVFCLPFLDAVHSPLLTRALWLPGDWWQTLNSYGEYCILRKKGVFH